MRFQMDSATNAVQIFLQKMLRNGNERQIFDNFKQRKIDRPEIIEYQRGF